MLNEQRVVSNPSERIIMFRSSRLASAYNSTPYRNKLAECTDLNCIKVFYQFLLSTINRAYNTYLEPSKFFFYRRHHHANTNPAINNGEGTWDATLWTKVHSMGQRLFDSLNEVQCDIRTRGHVSSETMNVANTMTSCGFCIGSMPHYRDNGQIQIRFGACGHLFHAPPDAMRSKSSCYNHYLEAKKISDSPCVHCRSKPRDISVSQYIAPQGDALGSRAGIIPLSGRNNNRNQNLGANGNQFQGGQNNGYKAQGNGTQGNGYKAQGNVTQGNGYGAQGNGTQGNGYGAQGNGTQGNCYGAQGNGTQGNGYGAQGNGTQGNGYGTNDNGYYAQGMQNTQTYNGQVRASRQSEHKHNKQHQPLKKMKRKHVSYEPPPAMQKNTLPQEPRRVSTETDTRRVSGNTDTAEDDTEELQLTQRRNYDDDLDDDDDSRSDSLSYEDGEEVK